MRLRASENFFKVCPGAETMARRVITGISRGVGAATAGRLSEEGISVVISYGGSKAEPAAARTLDIGQAATNGLYVNQDKESTRLSPEWPVRYG
jgi:NAD(P)-dependent dehydrogenase (short-subunit alcohol dehydrogenase family)